MAKVMRVSYKQKYETFALSVSYLAGMIFFSLFDGKVKSYIVSFPT